MNSLERVALTLQHKEADRIPVYPIINSVSRKTMGLSYETWTRDVDKCAEAIIRATDELDLDIMCSLVDLSVEAADWGQEILYSADNAACPNDANRLIKGVEDYGKIGPIDPRKTPRMSEHIELCRKMVEARGSEKAVVAFVFAPLGVASMLRGQAEFFMDMITHPDAVKACVGQINETLKEYCTALAETGVHAIMLDTLFASQSIMSEAMWDEFEGPFVEELADHIHSLGPMVMLHNCGNGSYFRNQIERMKPTAISFLHVPSDCSTYEEMAEKYGRDVTLIGHLDPGWLVGATEEEIDEECRVQIERYKAGGGFILATGCEYPSVLGLDKARVIVEAAKKYGSYR